MQEVFAMAIENRAIVIKPEKSKAFLETKPNSDAIEKAKRTVKKYGHNAKREYGKKSK